MYYRSNNGRYMCKGPHDPAASYYWMLETHMRLLVKDREYNSPYLAGYTKRTMDILGWIDNPIYLPIGQI